MPFHIRALHDIGCWMHPRDPKLLADITELVPLKCKLAV